MKSTGLTAWEVIYEALVECGFKGAGYMEVAAIMRALEESGYVIVPGRPTSAMAEAMRAAEGDTGRLQYTCFGSWWAGIEVAKREGRGG